MFLIVMFNVFLSIELEEKEEKLQQLNKQLEAKTQEAVRFKTAAEVAKVTISFHFDFIFI